MTITWQVEQARDPSHAPVTKQDPFILSSRIKEGITLHL